MLKTKSLLEVQIGERIYQLLCPNDAPLGEAHDVLCQMKKYIIDRITEVQKQENPEPVNPDEKDIHVEVVK